MFLVFCIGYEIFRRRSTDRYFMIDLVVVSACRRKFPKESEIRKKILDFQTTGRKFFSQMQKSVKSLKKAALRIICHKKILLR